MTAPPVPPRTSRWNDWYRRALPAYWVFLFCVTHLPKLKLDLYVPASDKLAHFAAFGLLAFLLWRFAGTFVATLSPRFVWRALVAVAAYAALDEWTQPYFNRSASLWDWLSDVVAAGAVLAILEWRRRRNLART